MTEEERAALDLYLTFEVGPHRDHFTAELYRLISKADFINKRKLKLSYPLHVAMYEEWMAMDAYDFYRKYSCEKNYTPEKT